MIPLYLYNNLHAGDVLFSRPLYRALAADGRFRLVLGAFYNNAYMLEDLCGPNVTLQVCDYLERGPTVLYDLAADCPADHLPISTWLGEYDDTGEHQWRNAVEVCRRQLAAHGIAFDPAPLLAGVPMIDFAPRPMRPMLPGAGIYVDNSRCRSGHSKFEFDLRAMSAEFPGHRLLCTQKPEPLARNCIDGSALDLRDLSALSEQCAVILGKGSGPFCCTYTEANRHRPRAVCGYYSEMSPTFWDYPGNPLAYLQSMDEVLDFVHAALQPNSVPEVSRC